MKMGIQVFLSGSPLARGRQSELSIYFLLIFWNIFHFKERPLADLTILPHPSVIASWILGLGWSWVRVEVGIRDPTSKTEADEPSRGQRDFSAEKYLWWLEIICIVIQLISCLTWQSPSERIHPGGQDFLKDLKIKSGLPARMNPFGRASLALAMTIHIKKKD